MSTTTTPSANKHFTKDPIADVDYCVDWIDWLDTGDTIASSEWTIPDGLGNHDQGHTGTTANVWLTGGTLGAKYELRNVIHTTQGCTMPKTITVTIENN